MSAYSGVAVHYSYTLSLSERMKIQKTLNGDSFLFSGIDLNEDGIDEIVARSQTCEQQCVFNILAYSNSEFISIGKIEAKHIALGRDYNNGVRNILAYKSDINDFEHDLYLWNALDRRYRVKE